VVSFSAEVAYTVLMALTQKAEGGHQADVARRAENENVHLLQSRGKVDRWC